MPDLAQRHHLRTELAQRGVRITRQRAILLDIIQSATRHLDAEALLHLARQRDPELNRATVYRTLGLLKRFGLIDELDLMHLEGEKHYYEVSRARSHIHLACFHCGAIEEFQTEAFDQLQRSVEAACQFTVKAGRLEFGGLCRNCREKAS